MQAWPSWVSAKKMMRRKSTLDEPTRTLNPRVAVLLRVVLMACLLLIGYMLYEMKQVEIINNQAVSLMKSEKYTEAIALLEKAHVTSSDNTNVLDSLCKAYYAAEQWDKASATAKELLQKNPGSVDAKKIIDGCALHQTDKK